MPNIFKRAYNFFGFGTGIKPVVTTDSRQGSYIRSRNNRSFTTTDLPSPELCSTVYACISLITGNISKLNLNVYKTTQKGKEIYYDHRWQKAINHSPDGRLSASKWVGYMVNNMLFDGGTYFYKQEVKGLEIERAIKPLLDPTAVIEKNGEIWYKFQNVDTWLPSKDIIFPYIYSRDTVTPISPISSIQNELRIQQGAERSVVNFFEKGIFRWLWVQADHEIGTGDKQKAREYFEKLSEEIAGAENAYEDGGILRVPAMYNLKQLQIPDLKYLEQASFTEKRIASIFHVPAFMLNIQEGGSSLKTSEQALSFKNNCLSPICSAIVKELNAKLLTYEERRNGISIGFDFSDLYDLDLQSRIEYYTGLFRMGAISVNETRQAFGFDKLDEENGELHFIQKQYYPLEWYDQNNLNLKLDTPAPPRAE